MKLISLTCSNLKFKSLIFNPGLNIINGIQLSDQEKKTYNGIGKSLSLTLISLMFGAKPDKKSKFQQYLSTYGVFTLSFSHGNVDYNIVKDFGEKEYFLNSEKLTYTKYIEKLDLLFCGKNKKVKFRHIFKAFVRVFGSSYYNDALSQQGMPLTDYLQRYINFFLLGIDTELVEKRYKTKTQIEKLTEAEKTVKEYEDALDKINISDKKDQLQELLEKKNSFIIAENYNTQRSIADNLTKEMNDLRDAIFVGNEKISNKRAEIDISSISELDIEKIKRVYEEAGFYFQESIYKKIEDVQIFHKTLLENRKTKLVNEISKLELEKTKKEKLLERKSIERDRIVSILDNSGALEEYYALLDTIKLIENDIAEANKYKEIINSFKKDKLRLTITNTEIKEESLIYISENSSKIENEEVIFRSLVKKFYSNTGGSLELVETKDAKYLYDIKIEVPKQESQGVGLVKIFCYDALVYILNTNLLGFMAHDGSIFSEMDPRQKAMIIKTVLELINKYDLQYYINMNENTYNEIVSSTVFNQAEKEYIKSSIILNLNDKPPKGWLFGESF